ncbi:MAG: AraC family transcriptional regulator [Lachnospiraceae bacterium]|nr:AraC family transcriptional regulator [Lachnospiraceae bacterium]
MEPNGNVCKFPITPISASEIVTSNFVFEKNWNPDTRLILSFFRMYFVSAGEGTLVTGEGSFSLSPGDVFFTFPAKEFEIVNSGGLKTIYISFSGRRAQPLCDRLRLTSQSPIRHGYGELEGFLTDMLDRTNLANGDLVTEAALLYVLSLVEPFPVTTEEGKGTEDSDIIVRVKKYADEHFTEKDLTLEKVSRGFGYSSHYLSARFVTAVGVSFREYLTGLRMHYAGNLIEGGASVVSEVADACGYADPLYFSKVFRKRYGCTAKEMIGKRKGERK